MDKINWYDYKADPSIEAYSKLNEIVDWINQQEKKKPIAPSTRLIKENSDIPEKECKCNHCNKTTVTECDEQDPIDTVIKGIFI